MEETNTAQSIIDFAKTHTLPQDVELGDEGHKVVAVPIGRTLESLKKFHDEWLDSPRRRSGTATLKTPLSLMEWVNRFKSDDSVLFADPGEGVGAERKPWITAVINYNPAGPETVDTGWGDHRGSYAFPLSEQWKLWKGIDGKPLNVKQFSSFIERQIQDIAPAEMAGNVAKQIPDRLGFQFAAPTDVLKLSKGLSVVVDHTVTNIIDNTTGERQLQFEQKHKDKAGKPMEVIKAFLLSIPVFEGGVVYAIGVRLTYEVEGDAVFFTCHLYREDLCFKDAFELTCEEVKNATQLPLYYGRPEATK